MKNKEQRYTSLINEMTTKFDMSTKLIGYISSYSKSNHGESEIIKNRNYSIKMRSQIRDYGLTFDWKILVEKYIKNVCDLLNNIKKEEPFIWARNIII